MKKIDKARANRDIEKTTLPNGLIIVTEKMPHVRSVSVGLWIDSGSRREEGEQGGISHFIEHMVFKGSRTRSAEDIARQMDALGGNLDAFTGKELVSFNTKVLDQHLPVAFDVLSDMVLRPVFRHEDIEREKGVILEELKMENDNPEYLLHETFSASFWKGHPLGRPIIGTQKTIRGFDRRMVGGFYRKVYTPANILVTAAGNLTHSQMVDLVSKQFQDLAAGSNRRKDYAPEPRAPMVVRDKPTLEQVHLMVGVPGYPVAHENRFVTYVLNTLLGGSMSSRLFQNIRERRGLVYAVFSEINSYRDSGCLTVYAGTARNTAGEVLRHILDEFAKLKTEPVPEEEMERSRSHLKGSVMLSLESTSSRMTNLARQQLYFGRFMTMDEMLDRIDKVTAEDVLRVACDLFRPKTVAVTALGPMAGIKLDRRLLQ